MGWASKYIEELNKGNVVSFRPRGDSMQGKIKSGQLCTVAPFEDLDIGDVVLCKVNGNQYLHLIKAFKGDQVQIGNNKGKINGWTTRKQIFGKLIKVED